MFEILSARVAGATGMLSLALFTAALALVPSFPTTGAGLSPAEPAVAVNRLHKADRLPVLGPTVRQLEFGPPPPAAPVAPARALPQSQIPPGCDGAFSPISSPRLAHIFRRCIA
jgi:hypothetical protein